MPTLTLKGLRQGGRIGPQVLGHQGARFVVDRSDAESIYDPASGMWVCPLDRIFTSPRSPIIVFGTPNVSLVLPDEQNTGWCRLAAFMLWRSKSYITSTKGRVQAAVFYELVGASAAAINALRQAAESLVGTRKASCAHSIALALHRAGFTTGGKSLRRVYRPSRLASILWRQGLEYRGNPIELRVIQTHRSIHSHFVGVWKREYDSVMRLIRKVLYTAANLPVPVFEPLQDEAVEMSDELWASNGPRTRIGVSLASPTGVNVSYVLGEQPEFITELPGFITDTRLQEPLKPFPGRLSTATKAKKYFLFSGPVRWFLRRNLAASVDWLNDVPLHAIPAMLRRSLGPERQRAFVYNFVITPEQIRIKRLLNNNGQDNRLVNWLLAKHILLAGRSKHILLAGELWCYMAANNELVVCLSGESGTYKPESERVVAAAELLGRIFNVRVDAVSRPTA